MTTPEQLFVLRKAKNGIRRREEIDEVCDELVKAGMLREKRTLLRRTKLLPTARGRQELLKASHATDPVVRAVASGLFDHLPFHLFEQIVNSPDVERYIDSQREMQNLMWMSQIMRRW